VTLSAETAVGGPVSGPAIVIHGQSHDVSTFKQTDIEINVPPQALAAPAVRYSLPPDAAAFTGRRSSRPLRWWL
jgi:hypothetical protein